MFPPTNRIVKMIRTVQYQDFLDRGRFLVFWVLCFCSLQGMAHPADSTYSFVAPDSEFVLKVARVKSEIVISVSVDSNVVFDYMCIERKVYFETSFSQCRYITYDEIKSKAWIIVRKDRYPYSAQADILYRIKYVTKDGVMRIFPSVFLPSVKD